MDENQGTQPLVGPESSSYGSTQKEEWRPDVPSQDDAWSRRGSLSSASTWSRRGSLSSVSSFEMTPTDHFDKKKRKKKKKKRTDEDKNLKVSLLDKQKQTGSYGSYEGDVNSLTKTFAPQNDDSGNRHQFGSSDNFVICEGDDSSSDSSKNLDDGKNGKKREKTDNELGLESYAKINVVDLFRYHSGADKRLLAVGGILSFLAEFHTIADFFILAQIVQSVADESDPGEAADKLVLGHRARRAYFNALLNQDMQYYDTVPTLAAVPSEMETRLLRAMAAQGAHLFNIIMLPLNLIFSLCIALYFSWPVTLIYLSTFPVSLVPLVAYKNYTSKSIALKEDAYSDANAIVQQTLQNFRTVVAFGAEARDSQRYADALDPARLRLWKDMLVQEGIFGVVAIGLAMFSVSTWYGSTVLIAENKTNPSTGDPYSPADVFVALMATSHVIISCRHVVDSYTVIVGGKHAVATMFKIIDTKPSIEPTHESEHRTPLPPKISNKLENVQFQNVRFAYPSRPDFEVLKGISFDIKAGEKVAFVGESGSGKSTVIQLFERFYNLSGGTISANGIDLKDLPVIAWRGLIGYVGQEPTLYAMSIMENIRLGNPSATDVDIKRAAKMARAHEFIELFPDKYETNVGSDGTQLSGGQKQRIAIARALVKKPRILLLDEATSALDNKSEKMVQATIDALQSKDGDARDLTVVTVAHRLSTIRHSDKIFFLSNGQVAEVGRHEDLMASKGMYYSLVSAQEATVHLEEETASQRRSSISRDNASGSSMTNNIESETSILIEGKPQAEATADKEGEKDELPPLEDITLDFVKKILKKKNKLVNDDTIAEARKHLIVERNNYDPYAAGTIKRLFSFTPKENKWLPLVFLAALIVGGFYPIYGFLAARGVETISVCEDSRVNGLIPENDPCIDDIDVDLAIYCAAVGVVVFAATVTLGTTVGYIMGWAVTRIRTQAFDGLLKQEISYQLNYKNTKYIQISSHKYHDHPDRFSGILASRLATSAISLSGLLCSMFVVILQILAALFIGVICSFWFSWQIAIVLTIGLPVIIWGSSAVSSALIASRTRAVLYAEGAHFSAESILSVRNIRALNAQNVMVWKYMKILEEPHDFMKKQLPKYAIVAVYFMFAILILTITMYGFGSWLVRHEHIVTSDIYGSQMCILLAMAIVSSRLPNIPDIELGKLAGYDLFSMMDRESRMDATAEPLPDAVKTLGDGMITFNDVNFRFQHRPDVQVLNNVSFSVKLGSTVAFVGPSGSGKSTIIQMLMRFYDPTEGTVFVGGNDLKDFDLAWWRKNIGFVQQEPVLFDLSVEDNIKYGKPDATHAEVVQAAKLANIDFVGRGKSIQWNEHVGVKGQQLSGGQKQRLAIARAMIRDPSFLLLDEATSALDSQSERIVQQAIDNAAKGRTTFMVAHRLSTVQHCDRIFVIVAGNLLEQGTHEELLRDTNGMYAKLAGAGRRQNKNDK